MPASRLAALAALCLGLYAAAGGLRAQPQPPDVVVVLKGHTETVEAVAVSADGKFVATGCFDKTVRLFDAATGKEVRAYSGPQGHTNQVLCVAFSAKGDQIATGGADNKVCVWDVPVSFPVKTYATTGAGTGVAVATDGKTFAVAGADGVVKVFPAGEEKGAIELKGHTGAVVGVGYLTTGNIWVTAGADKTVRFFTAADGKQTASYSPGTAEITGLAVRPDSQAVVTTSADGVLRFWQTPPQVTRAFPALKDAVTAFYSTADGNTLLYASADKVVTMGSTSNNAAAGTFPGAKAAVEAVTLSPDTQTVAAGCADGSLILWDRQGKVKAEVPAHAGGVSAVVFHPGQPLLFTAGADGQVKGWKLPLDPKKPKEKDKDGKEKDVKLTQVEIKAHTGKVTAALLNPANGQLVTAGADKLVRFWDIAKPEKAVKEIGPLAAPVTVLALSRDNATLAAGVGKDVMLWTLADGKDAGKLAQPADVLSLSFNADKTRLLIGRSDNLAVLAEVATGNVFQAFPHAGAVRGVVAHPGAPAVVTASADKTVVISPVTCTRIIPLGAGKPGVIVSPNSASVVSIGPGKEAVTWNSNNGTKEKAFEAGATATAAAVSKDGQRIAVGGSDGSVKLYTVADAKLVGSIAAGAPVAELAFQPTPQPTNAVLVGLLKDKDNSAVAWNVAFTPGQPLPPEFGRQMQAFPHAPPAVPAASLAFNADGQFFTAGGDKQLRRFRIAADSPVKTLPHPNLVDCVAFDDTGDRLATGCHDGNLRVFDLPKNTPLKTIEAHVVKMPQPVQNPIYAVQWTSDYKQVFTASYDKTIKLWDAAAGTMVREFKAAPDPVPDAPPKKDEKAPPPPPRKDEGPVGHRDQVFSIALSKDGKFLASGSSDKTVKLWDVATAKVVRDFQNPDLKPVFPGEPVPSHPGWVHAVRFTPDGTQLVTAGAAPRGKSDIAVWDVADGKRLFGAERDFGPIHTMALLPDGTRMVIGFAGIPRNKIEPGAMILKVPGK
jgi:WD40 repeat protein